MSKLQLVLNVCSHVTTHGEFYTARKAVMKMTSCSGFKIISREMENELRLSYPRSKNKLVWQRPGCSCLISIKERSAKDQLAKNTALIDYTVWHQL